MRPRLLLLLLPLCALAIGLFGSVGTAHEQPVPTPITPLPEPATDIEAEAPTPTPLPDPVDLGARVRRSTQLRDAPGGDVVGRIDSRTEFGSPRILPVIRRRDGWLAVIATQRPNGELAWIPEANVTLVNEPVRLRIDLSDHELIVVRTGRVVHRMPIGIGAPATPTPTGWFAVTDGMRWRGSPVYGCCVLALSGHQPHLAQGWTGGDRIAVHGTNAPATIGLATSLGCLHGGDADMRRLLATATLGARVLIRA